MEYKDYKVSYKLTGHPNRKSTCWMTSKDADAALKVIKRGSGVHDARVEVKPGH